jgi:DNA-binding Lrp family transcriptional regulator
MEEHEIKFSRHAKRRMALYAISESTVRNIIEGLKEAGISVGKNEVIDYQTVSRQGYPIKVVFSCEENHVTVITVYPLRRGKK